MTQRDRHPGKREEDEIYLVPGSDDPTTENGHFLYKTGVGFRFYEEGTEKGLTGTGLSEASHKSLDTLIHNLSEDGYEEVTRSVGKVSNITFWDSASKTKKIRETIIARTSGKVSQVDLVQYDSSGTESSRMTGVIARSSGKVSNITWTETVA